MVRKKLDERIRTLLSHSLRTNTRSLLLLVGDHGKDQVPNLHQILRRTADQSKSERIQQVGNDSVLWCYKKELGFSTHRKKRMEKLKRDKKRGLAKGTGGAAAEHADNFELFLSSADITWCYYKDSHRVLGTTHSLLVLQDFEALTPNIMARTVETVRGGGLVIFLLRTVTSLKQLYAMTMDVHSRYRTEGGGAVTTPRFNERFILSLGSCPNCLVCDDELNILPLSKKTLGRLSQMGLAGGVEDGEGGGKNRKDVLSYKTDDDVQLEHLKETLRDTPHVGKLVELTKTLDQARAVLTFLEACADRDARDDSPPASAPGTSATVVSLTAARGRGKSAALGLCLAGAISFGFTSVAVTAPSPENLVSVFQFLVEGLKALKYQEHYDYTLGYNYGGTDGDGSFGGGGNNRGEKAGRDNTKCVVSVTVHSSGAKGGRRQKRQTVRYVPPRDVDKFAGAELVAIDEAAAIPLPVVRDLMQLTSRRGKGEAAGAGDEGGGRRLTFLSSTVNGYEGTGRALSLKLIKELRDAGPAGASAGAAAVDAAREAGAGVAGAASKKGEAKVHERRWAAAAAAAKGAAASASSSGSPSLKELELSRPIRYASGDPVEAWLNGLLCLDCDGASFGVDNTLRSQNGKGAADNGAMELKGGAPSPTECELYRVDRDALFSYHRLSESFLQKLWGLYTSAHYKNAPNDLQMLSDAPAHALFVLLGPAAEDAAGGDDALPDVLAVVQTSLEGRLSRKTVQAQLARGHRAAGDLIPWTVSQQFGDGNFAQLNGARVVRVAVHPGVQGMGYGSRAMELLYRYYNGEMVSLDGDGESDDENESSDNETPSESESDDEEPASDALLHKESPKPRKKLPPLLLPLSSVPTPKLDWLGTSFGLTPALHNFWSRRAGMTLLYLRQTPNDLTGERSAIMIRALPKRSGWDDAWLPAFGADARRRVARLLGGAFRGMEVRLASALLGDAAAHSRDEGRVKDPVAVQEMQKRSGSASPRLTPAELRCHLTSHDLQRLELYGRNLCDHHLVNDLVPSLATLYFNGRMTGWGNDNGEFRLSSVQSALLCGMGLQRKGVDELADELALPINQVLAMFNKAVKKMSTAFHNLLVEEESKDMLGKGDEDEVKKAEANVRRIRDVVGQTLDEEEAEGAAAAMEALEQRQQTQAKAPKMGANNNSGVTGTRLPAEINDPEIMQYALKGTDEEWANALKETGAADVVGGGSGGTIQVKRTKMKTPKKRKAEESSEDVMESVMKNEKNMMASSGKKKKEKKSKTRKSRKS